MDNDTVSYLDNPMFLRLVYRFVKKEKEKKHARYRTQQFFRNAQVAQQFNKSMPRHLPFWNFIPRTNDFCFRNDSR